MKKVSYVFGLTALCYFAMMRNSEAQTTIFGSPRAQVETHIAVNLTDPNNLIGTAITQLDGTPNQIASYYSFNGGQSWNGNENISGSISAGDPVVAFDPDGTAYLLYQIITASGLYLHKSTDGGVTWAGPTTVTQVNPALNTVDRPWMAISPLRNASGKFDIYVSHTLFDNQSGTNSSTIKLLKSTNGGTSFSSVHTASSASGVAHGSSVAIGPNGEVFLAWANLNSTTTAVESISMKRSTDGGSNFSNLNTVTAFQIGSKAGNDYALKQGSVRADSYPRLAVDTSPGAYRGYAYVIWSGKQSANGNPDVLIVRWKKNAGGNFEWSGIEIVDQSTGDQWMPAINVSPDGVASVLYYSSQTGMSDPIYTYLRNSTNGGQSFSGIVNVGTATGFTIEQSGSTFLGDYHGLAGWFGKANALWCENRNHGSNNKRQAYFRAVNVTEVTPTGYQYVAVDQVDESNQPFEKFGRWNQNAFTNYKAPFRFLFQTNANEIIRAKQDFKTGTTQKYNLWQGYSSVVNHQTFTIATNQQPIKTQFKIANNATIRTELIDGGSGGNIEFRDPWLIDDLSDTKGPRNRGTNAIWYTKTSPFSPNTSDPNYKGVLKDQLVEPGKPYYSARASSSQSINGFTWLFQNWTATGATPTQPTNTETPVVFTAANGEVKARLKAHLGTNSTVATAYNNQRKLAYDGTNYHLVYESAGEIYYLSSSDNGATWSNEVLVSDGNGGNKYPSIDLINGIIVIVWQKELTGTGKICMRRKTASGWQAQQEATSFLASAGFTATPVVAVYSAPYYFIIWHDYDNNNLTIRSYNESSGTFGTETAISSTNSNSFYPALAADTYGKLHLAWAESGKIYYSKISHSGGNYSYDANKEEVTLNYGSFSTHSFPAITTDYSRRPNVVWEEYHSVTYVRSIVHRRRELSGSWSSFTTFSPNDDEYLKPSIGSHFNISNNNNLEVGWYVLYTNQLKLAKYNGTSWSQFTQTPSGQFPGMSQDLSTTTPVKAKMVYRGVSGTPFALATTSQNLPKTTDQLQVHYRRGVLGIEGAELSFELGEFGVSGTKINLFPYVDTLAVGHTGQWEEMFRTESFQVSDQTNLSFLRKFDIKNPEPLKNVLPIGAKVEFRLEVMDAPSNQVLAVIDRQVITRNIPPPSNERRDFVLRLAGNKEVFLRVGLEIPGGMKPLHAVVESYIEMKSDSVSKALAENPTQVELTPTQFALIQNYPNPFNPETVIKYMLPNSGYVSLRVFNIQGQEVTTLVDAYQSAGRYEVSWDGRDHSRRPVAAGLYFYQMRAGDFRQVQRMVFA